MTGNSRGSRHRRKFSHGPQRTLRQRLLGAPHDLRDASVFRHISLVAFFAWVGLGADGLSSSAYGPEEAFRHLEQHRYLAVLLAAAMAATVLLIAASYRRIIERFPAGGGGYVVASKLLGERVGLISGAALLVDYVLTITISIAAGVNAVFAFLPGSLATLELASAVLLILVLVVMNLRGVKESVLLLTPIFLVFLITHAVLILGAIGGNLGGLLDVGAQVKQGLARDLPNLGVVGLLLVFARAYSLGGGTFTGIEAVSNGLAIMREPRVETGKRTMTLMAISLALTAGGILFAYLLLGVHPSESEPMNAVLAKALAHDWRIGGLDVGAAFVVVTLASEGALLFVAAQAGFIDGPRVMANMAVDSWLPHRLSALSERLTMRNGVFLMGSAALVALLYTRGDVHLLVVMYSINVFVTFTLSNLAMLRLSLRERREVRGSGRAQLVHGLALAVCTTILMVTIFEKFGAGGWVTLLATAGVVALAGAVRTHYRRVGRKLRDLDAALAPLANGAPESPPASRADEALSPEAATAVVLVGGYGGIGIHTLLQIERVFPKQFRQVVFVSAGIVDSGVFKGPEAIEALRERTRSDLERYVRLAHARLGWRADLDLVIGTDVVQELERLCREICLRFPRSVFFAGQLVFRRSSWWHRLLHNETAYAVQRRLQFAELPMVLMPIRVT